MSKHALAKGNVYLIIAHISELAGGYIIHFGLVRVIDPVSYGIIGVLLSFFVVIQMFLAQGLPTAVSKYLSEGYDGIDIRYKSTILNLSFCLIIIVILYVFAPFFAGLMNDAELAPYIRFFAFLIVARGMNYIYNHYFSGYRKFSQQAIHIIIESIAKVVLVFSFISLGYVIYGVLGGYALSSLMAMIYALIVFKPQKTDRKISYAKLITFSIPVIIYSFFIQLISTIDLLMLKASSINGSFIGYYSSARVMASLNMVIATAFSFTLLPSISKSIAEKKNDLTKSYIKYSMKYILLVSIPIVFLISANSNELLSFLFTKEYAFASDALSILAWGWFFLNLFYIFATMLNACGKPIIPAIIAGIAVLIAGMCNYILINKFGLIGAAGATLAAGIFCFISGLYFVYKHYKVSLNLISLAKVLLVSCIVFLPSLLIEAGGIWLIALCGISFFIYITGLIAIKEINDTDIKMLKELFLSMANGIAKRNIRA